MTRSNTGLIAQNAYDWRECTEEISGSDLHEFFERVIGEPSPSGWAALPETSEDTWCRSIIDQIGAWVNDAHAPIGAEREQDMKPMTVRDLIDFLKTQPPDLPVAYYCYSEQVLLERGDIHIAEKCLPREDGWVHDRRPDKEAQAYLMFPGN